MAKAIGKPARLFGGARGVLGRPALNRLQQFSRLARADIRTATPVMQGETMLPTKYGLADVDGILCVTCETPDYARPVWVKLHWPSKCRTRDALRFFEVDTLAELELFAGRIPGDYSISRRNQPRCTYYANQPIYLIDGGRTQSVKVDTRDYAPPKRSPQREYRDGAWHHMRGGRWVRWEGGETCAK